MNYQMTTGIEPKGKARRWLAGPPLPTVLFLLLILLLGSLLRLHHLDYKSLWIDELYSIVPVNPNNTIGFIIDHCKADQPPLFFLLAHYWFKVTSYTPFAGRLLAAIFGILGIIVIYFLGREIKNERTGVFAAFLTAINYYHIYYSQELRFYSLLFLLAALSFLYFIRGLKRRSPGSYILYTVSTIALLYTQYFGIVVFAIQGFIFLIYIIVYREKVSVILTGIGMAIVISAAFIPWLPTLLRDSQISSYWIPMPEPYFLTIYYYLYWGKDVFTALLLMAVGFLYLANLFRKARTKTMSRYDTLIALILALWIILSYGLPYLRSVFSTPMLIPRYTLVTLPAIFVVIALGFDLIKSIHVRMLVVVLATTATLINLFLVQKHYTTHDKAQWREAAHAVIDNHEPGVKVYSNLEWWYNFYFYFTDPYIRVIGKYSSDENAELEPFIAEIGNEKKFWVLNGEGVSGLNGLQQAYVDQRFEVEKRYDFFAASAILYTAK